MKRSKRWIVVVALCAVALIVYGGLYGWIQWDANQKAKKIWSSHPQASNQVDALLMLVQSDLAVMQERNQAVWVIGRLRMEEALPVLQSYYTGNECRHDDDLCQRELKKAICRCGGTL